MPNSKGRRRRFGAIRHLPSGRYQARYPGPDGVIRPADDTFGTKRDAEEWLTRKEAEILENDWIDPDAGEVLLNDYGKTWIDERPALRSKTVMLYRYLLRSHIAPYFPSMTIARLNLAAVRRWRKKLLDNGVSPVTVAKAYRLLRAIMYTAVEDELIRRNPCRIKGAGSEESPERPVLTVTQVYALADTIGPRYRALILLATFASLRWSELAALTPQDIDLDACTVRVTRQINYPPGGGHSFGPPKSAPAGVSSRSLNSSCPSCGSTLTPSTQAADLAFTSPDGKPLRHSNFYRAYLDACAYCYRPARYSSSRPAAHRKPVHR